MGEVLEFSELFQESRGAMNPARLKLQSQNMIFKNNKTGKTEQYSVADIEKVHWIFRAKGHCMKLFLKNDTTHRIDGFRDTDYDKLSAFLQKNYNLKLEKKDMSLKGWNWGNVIFNANTMEFQVDGLTAFEIPLSNVSHSQTAKNEVAIEFHPNDDAPVQLMEMRFYIPSDSTSDTDPVAEFQKNVMAKADVVQAAGDAITIFTEVQCLTPRGRYDIKIYPTFLQLHGKTFDYKIPYSTILRLFLLPHRDGRQMFFVVSLDPPIKQGQTRYHFLILLFNKEEEMTLQLSLPEAELKKYDGKLQKEMSGAEYEMVSRVMKALVNKKITVPGSFIGHTGTNSIACSYRAATGALYPLERGFIFVHKPPLHIRFDEVASVNFARSAGSTRSFDFDVETKAGTVYTFVGIEKEEYGKLFDFVQQKKLRVKNTGKADTKTVASYSDDDDSEGDDHDAYLVKMKAEGKERTDIGTGGGGDDDDDEDESDEDFQPQGSASEPDDEYDSNAPSTAESEEGDDDKGSGSSDQEEDVRPKSRKEDKKPPPKKHEGSDEESEDELMATVKGKPPAAAAARKKSDKPKSQKETKSKKPKKERDADRPKRPQTAYFLWFSEIRPKLKDSYPGLSVSELAKKAGEKWKEVKDKSKWEQKALEEKKAYEVAMAEYNQKQGGSKVGPSSSSSSGKKVQKKLTESFTAAKSKEFISDTESSDSEDKPLRKSKTSQSPKASEDVEMSSSPVDSSKEEEIEMSD